MSAVADAFGAAVGSSDRFVWFDGEGFDGAWSGRGGMVGVLTEEDVSLTFDASRGLVRRHQGGHSAAVGDDIFTVLEQEVARSGPSVLWAGYLGYACRRDLPAATAAPVAAVPVPDAVWLRVPRSSLHPLLNRPSFEVESPLVTAGPARRAAQPRTEGGSTSNGGRFEEGPEAGRAAGCPDEGYGRAFAEVQRQLRSGNSYEVNLTYRERLASTIDPVTAYLRLRARNPAPYSGYLRHRGVHLLSSSPERYAAVDARRILEARPIKGTTPRGTTPDDDERHRIRLATDAKFRAENLMIVDLLRNDLSMVCDPGTVTVPELMAVESYPSVHQLVSTVRGRLSDGVSTVAALRTLFPAGSMTGAPKRRTMQIIEAVEATRRGVYAGAFGWVAGDRTADLSVVIRSLIGTASAPRAVMEGGSTSNEGRLDEGWVYELGTGGGITVRSTMEEEYAETRWKAARLRAALQQSDDD
jgi:para-aminobenzoate synthetase